MAVDTRVLQRNLEDKDRALQLAEAKIQEMRAIMTDLLCDIGEKENCAKCGEPTFWIRPRGTTTARLVNLDGTQHWPRCPQTAPPRPVLGHTA